MKKITGYLIFSFLLTILLSGCNSNPSSKADVFQYKDSYIGDNSAVNNIVQQLSHSKELSQISLETKKEPYGVVLEYKDINATEIDKEIKKTVITNSTYMFVLIQNLDWITFKFTNQEFLITRENLEKWYGKELYKFTNKKDLKDFIQVHLKDKNTMNQFFQK